MSHRPPVFTWNEELHFGPPSNHIDIQKFVGDAQSLQSCGRSPWLESNFMDNGKPDIWQAIASWKEWHDLPKERRASIEQDCALDDLTSSFTTILSSQKHMHHLQHVHADAVSQLSATQPSKKTRGKGKQPVGNNDPDLEKFRNLVEHTPLRNWKLKAAAKPYIRNGHISDQNALDTLLSDTENKDTAHSHEALITLTTYTRNSWYPYALSRDSQYALLSNNTLADVWSCVPCVLRGSGGMPIEIKELPADYDALDECTTPRREIVGYGIGDSRSDPDEVVMVVEGVVYSNAGGPLNYAEKLLSHIQRFKSQRTPDAPPPLPPGPYERATRAVPLTQGHTMEAVQLRALTLRINEPYWILHRGSCEHWFIVDEIRLQNPHDPTLGYPIGLQRTPVSRPLCRICSKVPATLSVLNDIKLGESPGLVCQPCWELFDGLPRTHEDSALDNPAAVVSAAFQT